jgi:uroporphyrinogen-III synthase
VKSQDFIKVSPNRISAYELKKEKRNVIITSQNAVEALLANVAPEDLKFENIYCVGRKTKRLIERRIGPVKHQEKNAEKLAGYLVEYMEGLEVTYFCSNLRLDTLPVILAENNIKVDEIEAYKTRHAPAEVDNDIEGVMFYSPSTVESYMLKNDADKVAYCIGETTAAEARKYFSKVRVAKIPTVESLIELVNEDYK